MERTAPLKTDNPTARLVKYNITHPNGTIFDDANLSIQYGNRPRDKVEFKCFGSDLRLHAHVFNVIIMDFAEIKAILKAEGCQALPSQASIERKAMANDTGQLAELYRLCLKYRTSSMYTTPDSTTFIARCREEPIQWIFRTVLSMAVLDRIMSRTHKVQDRIMQRFAKQIA